MDSMEKAFWFCVVFAGIGAAVGLAYWACFY